MKDFLKDESRCVFAVCRDFGNESRGLQRLQATKVRMLRMICGVTLKDKVKSTVIALRVEWAI